MTLTKIITQSAGAVKYIDSFSDYDTKESDGEVQVMLELSGMRCTLSLPSPQGQLCPRVEAPDRVLSMGQIELFLKLKLCTYAKLNY